MKPEDKEVLALGLEVADKLGEHFKVCSDCDTDFFKCLALKDVKALEKFEVLPCETGLKLYEQMASEVQFARQVIEKVDYAEFQNAVIEEVNRRNLFKKEG